MVRVVNIRKAEGNGILTSSAASGSWSPRIDASISEAPGLSLAAR